MDPKVAAILEKAHQEKARGNPRKALKRLTDAVAKYPGTLNLYLDAADLCLEVGESLEAIALLKRASVKAANHKPQITEYCLDKVHASNDPVLGKFVLEECLKARDMRAAQTCAVAMDDRTARELLQRARNKQRTLDSAVHGGYSLMKERVVNAMSEALLCARLGKVQEAVKLFIRIMDERELERPALGELFEILVELHPASAHVRFGLACALMYTETKVDRAIAEMVEAVHMDRGIAGDCLGRLRIVEAGAHELPAAHVKGLAAILLANGDHTRAAEILSGFADREPGQLPVVMAMLDAHLEAARSNAGLACLYMRAAISVDDPARALSLAKSATDPTVQDAVFEWLDDYSRRRPLPDELVMYLGERALARGRVDRGLELLKAIAAKSAEHIPAVARLLEAHRSEDPRIAAAVDSQEHAADGAKIGDNEDLCDDDAAPRPAAGAVEIEPLDTTEFSFSSGMAVDEGNSESTGDRTGVDGITIDRGFSGFDGSAGSAAPTSGETVEARAERQQRTMRRFQPREFMWLEEDESGEAEDTEGFTFAGDRSESSSADLNDATDTVAEEPADEAPAPVTPADGTGTPVDGPGTPADGSGGVDEAFVNNLSTALKSAGNAMFFQEDPGAAESAADFDARYGEFVDGRLDDDDVLAVMREAIELGRWECLEELLTFEPDGEGAAYERARCEIELHMHRGRHLAARAKLEKLAHLRGERTDQEWILPRLATCQRAMADYSTAADTFERLQALSPDSTVVSEWAQRNYADYLADQCEDVRVLEKVSSIDER